MLGETEPQEEAETWTEEELYDYLEDLDEAETIASNAIAALENAESDERLAGEAVQLHLAAMAAFGEAKGKGKSTRWYGQR